MSTRERVYAVCYAPEDGRYGDAPYFASGYRSRAEAQANCDVWNSAPKQFGRYVIVIIMLEPGATIEYPETAASGALETTAP